MARFPRPVGLVAKVRGGRPHGAVTGRGGGPGGVAGRAPVCRHTCAVPLHGPHRGFTHATDCRWCGSTVTASGAIIARRARRGGIQPNRMTSSVCAMRSLHAAQIVLSLSIFSSESSQAPLVAMRGSYSGSILRIHTLARGRVPDGSSTTCSTKASWISTSRTASSTSSGSFLNAWRCATHTSWGSSSR